VRSPTLQSPPLSIVTKTVWSAVDLKMYYAYIFIRMPHLQKGMELEADPNAGDVPSQPLARKKFDRLRSQALTCPLPQKQKNWPHEGYQPANRWNGWCHAR
jgi:hypothetical protein